MKVLLTLLITSSALAGEQPLCLRKIGSDMNKEKIDLLVRTPPTKKLIHKPKDPYESKKFYIQNGKYIYSKTDLDPKDKTYCEVTFYDGSSFFPFESIWKTKDPNTKVPTHHVRMHTKRGDEEEPPMLSISPTARPYVDYDCPYLSTYDDLRKELSPVIDVPCVDWVDLLPKTMNPGTTKCDK